LCACRHPAKHLSLDEDFSRVRTEFEKGNLDVALKDVEALSSRVSTLGEDWVWRVRLLQAEIIVWRGKSEEILSLLQSKVPDSLASRDYAARRLILLGLAFGHLHRFEESERSFQTAQNLAFASHPEILGEVYLARGSVQVDQSLYKEALNSYQIAYQKAREFRQPFLQANAAGSLGYALTWLERYDEAIDWYKTSLEASDSFGARATSAKTLGNLGWSYHELGDLQNSLSQFEKAEEESRIAGLESDRAYWLNNAGTVDYDLGNYESAKTRLVKALELAQNIHDLPTIIECFENLALLAIETGQYVEAHDRLAAAAAANASFPNPDFKRTQYQLLLSAELAFREARLGDAVGMLSQIKLSTGTPTSLLWEARATLAQVHAAQHKFSLAESEYSESINTISKAQDSIEHEDFRLSFLSNSIRFYDQYVNFLLAQNRPLDALRIADQSRAQALEHGLSSSGGNIYKALRVSEFHPQEIARRQNASLLFYWIGKTNSFVWVITPKKVTLLQLPTRSEIETVTAGYRRFFLDPRDPLESGDANGKKLYDVLVRPAEKLIPKNSRVVILPDGSLTGLNFETLIVSGPQPHYWIEEVTVSIANSLSLLAHARPGPPPKSPNLLFFGDALPASKEFPPLADARKEEAALQNHFPANRSTFFTGDRATPSNYLASKPGRYSFIHFATHGTASVTRPLESAIILSPEGDSYKLYARDIVQQPLNAYLVSISACNGAGDRVLAGEGLVGLSWAFLRAGAHNVVAGLWEVSTASAPQLMDDLYKGIAAGQDPATALRNAKLQLVHSKGPYHRPFYWAPFQLYSGS
jgi:CHAT domain-containing protein